MKIKKIKLNNYGKLENKEINLKNNLNIIYGENESGKSTLLNFIKNIFYGISKNKNGKNISDYDKFKPWGKEEFSGKLQYELDNGEDIEIFRDFNKKKPKIFNSELEDISKNFNVDKKDGIQFFYEQTGVDETMFTSTVLAMQEEVKLDSQEQSLLIQKLANLAGTGDDSLSYKKLIDRLNKMQIEEIGTDRSQGRPVNIVKERLKNIEFVLKELNGYQKDKDNNDTIKEELLGKINKLKDEVELYKQASTILLRKQTEEEKINIKKKYENEKDIKIEQLKKEKNELIKKINENNNRKNVNKNNLINFSKKNDENNFNNNSEKNKLKNKNKLIKKINYKKYILILFLILIINILFFIFNNNYLKNNIINIFNFLVIPIYLIIIFIYEKIKNKKIENKIKLENEKIINEINLQNEKINYEINVLDKQIDLLENEKNIQEQEIQNEEIKLDNIIEIELQNLKQTYNNKLNVNEYLEKAENNNINILINEKQEKLNKNKMDLQTINFQETNISNKLEEMVNLQEEYEELKERLEELEKRNNEINITKEFLTKAYINMKNNITPKFTENLSKNISEISNGKYTKVAVNEDKGLIIENEHGEYISAELLSIGTIDQLYLSLRLSMINELSKEKMPIILDETFAYYDEERLKNILKFLSNTLNEHQVIIFTCTQREKSMLDKLGIKYNLVEL